MAIIEILTFLCINLQHNLPSLSLFHYLYLVIFFLNRLDLFLLYLSQNFKQIILLFCGPLCSSSQVLTLGLARDMALVKFVKILNFFGWSYCFIDSHFKFNRDDRDGSVSYDTLILMVFEVYAKSTIFMIHKWPEPIWNFG